MTICTEIHLNYINYKCIIPPCDIFTSLGQSMLPLHVYVNFSIIKKGRTADIAALILHFEMDSFDMSYKITPCAKRCRALLAYYVLLFFVY